MINLVELRHLSVPYPQLEKQNGVVAKLHGVEAETLRLAILYQRKLAALEALKKSLLPQAFTDEL